MIGFYRLRERFQKAIENNTLSHAHIIEGADGVGKSALAEHLARTIIGRGDRDSVDIVRVRPEKTTIGVNQIRELVLEASLKPYEGERKVIIIYQADKMTTEGQNALLKTIEEPLPGVVFFLLVENSLFMMETIKSRCHMHSLLPLNRQEMERYIREFIQRRNAAESGTASRKGSVKKKAVPILHMPEVTQMESILVLSRGIPERAEALLIEKYEDPSLRTATGLLKALIDVKKEQKRSYASVLECMSQIKEQELGIFFDDMVYVIHCVLKEKALQENPFREGFMYDDVQYIGQELTFNSLERYLNILYNMRKYVLPGVNINKETIAGSLLLKLLEV